MCNKCKGFITKQTVILIFSFFLVTFSFAQQNLTWKDLTQRAGNMQSMVYKTTPDTSLRIYYIKPEYADKKKLNPAIIWIHGGGWTSGVANLFFDHAIYFANRGAVGISIEYRLIGKNKTNSIFDEIKDCKSAIRFIKTHAKELGVDTSKLIVAGDSAGGYLAAATVTLDQFNDNLDDLSISTVPNAMVLYNPCVDFGIFPFIKNIFDYPIKLAPIPSDTIAFLQNNSNRIKEVSPLFNIKKIKSNILLIHGLNDKIIPHEQSEQFTEAMKMYGNKAQLILLPETKHAFIVPHYTASEQKVVNALLLADTFITSLGYLKGKPNLISGDDPYWLQRK